MKAMSEIRTEMGVSCQKLELILCFLLQQVSWVRRRDWHILASGRNVYTADDRFKIDHVDGGDEWTLVIKYVQQRDQGMFE